MNVREKLLKMYTKYPVAQTTDAVKLLYQSEFGGGHMISDEGKSLERIYSESLKITSDFGKNRQKCNDADSFFEPIGDGICRADLAVLQEGLTAETLNRMFVLTAGWKKGTVAGFEQKLQELVSLSETGELPLSPEDVKAYLSAYRAQGYPPVSHSETYREHYHPSYRIVDEIFGTYYPVFLAIDRALAVSEQVTAAVDGRCGAGKSTLGALLQKVYDCNLIHMDHFFLRPGQRTAKRLGEAGGNVDYERFRDEVLDHLRDPEGFSYQIYDCSRMELGERKFMPCKRLNIIEGSYSQHPYFGNVYDLRFFCEIEPEEQLRRIEKRNGPDMRKRFEREWIPMENRYFESFGIREKSLVV